MAVRERSFRRRPMQRPPPPVHPHQVEVIAASVAWPGSAKSRSDPNFFAGGVTCFSNGGYRLGLLSAQKRVDRLGRWGSNALEGKWQAGMTRSLFKIANSGLHPFLLPSCFFKRTIRMPDKPWKSWVPGVLSKRQVSALCAEGYLPGVEDAHKEKFDESAIDLHLTSEAYELTRGSVKPSGKRYLHQLTSQNLTNSLQPEDDETFMLKRGVTYLFNVREKLNDLADSRLYGQATAKSSIGRMDILARLIVDGMDDYESFDSRKCGTDMFVEITPITFNVRVKSGIALTQLRLFYGPIQNVQLEGKEIWESSLLNGPKKDGFLHVDLNSLTIGGLSVAAYRAKKGVPGDPIDLWDKDESEKPRPWEYFDFLEADSGGRLELEPRAFYILRSRERISLPNGVAVYCRAIDETIGEMRIHYAGFVHPLFGRNREDGTFGTPLMFEVRGHDVKISLKDGEKMARLTFYRMSEDANISENESISEDAPDATKKSSYENQ